MVRIAAILVLAVATFAATSSADVLHLKNGRKFEGQLVSETADRIVFKIKGLGPQSFRKSDVVRVEKSDSIFDEYERRRSEIGATDADGQTALGIWCAEVGLRQEGRAAFEAALAIDADHAGARRALGYTRVKDRWLDRKAYREYQEERRRKLEAVLGAIALGDLKWEKSVGLGCRPPKGWERRETEAGAAVEYVGPAVHGVSLRFGFDRSEPLDPALVRAGVRRTLKAAVGEVRPVRDDAPASIAGAVARADVVRYGPADQEVERRDVWLGRESVLVHVWYEGPVEDFEAIAGVFGDVLASFVLDDPNSGKPAAGKVFEFDLPGDDWQRGMPFGVETEFPEDMLHAEVIHHTMHPTVGLLFAMEAEPGPDLLAPEAGQTPEKILEGMGMDGVQAAPNSRTERKVGGVRAMQFELRGSTEGQPFEGIICVFQKGDRVYTVVMMNLLSTMDMRYVRQDFGKLLDSFRMP